MPIPSDSRTVSDLHDFDRNMDQVFSEIRQEAQARTMSREEIELIGWEEQSSYRFAEEPPPESVRGDDSMLHGLWNVCEVIGYSYLPDGYIYRRAKLHACVFSLAEFRLDAGIAKFDTKVKEQIFLLDLCEKAEKYGNLIRRTGTNQNALIYQKGLFQSNLTREQYERIAPTSPEPPHTQWLRAKSRIPEGQRQSTHLVDAEFNRSVTCEDRNWADNLRMGHRDFYADSDSDSDSEAPPAYAPSEPTHAPTETSASAMSRNSEASMQAEQCVAGVASMTLEGYTTPNAAVRQTRIPQPVSTPFVTRRR
ncbi:hypothetical protein ACH4C6_33835 [Streptomyces sp. NPDC017943]|uniref:hypothetical protein n=1 Tax=Streptomyces sp. NPDC017943 TaxID=3365019 RepID=UPI0037BC8340